MKNKLINNIEKKIAIVFVSGSIGELDWNLPILDFLLNEGFDLKIIILKKEVYESIKKNKLINNFISQNSKIEVIFQGGCFIEKIEHYVYLFYRILIKLNIYRYSLISNIFNFLSKIFHEVFFSRMPSYIFRNKKNRYLFLSEFPSLRRPRDAWIRKKFINSIFLYHPHSPNIYAEDLDQRYKSPENIDYNKRYFLLLGHQLDYLKINDERELAATNLEKVFVGHPKWSHKWLDRNRCKLKNFSSTSLDKNKTSILILSRGPAGSSDEKYYKNLIESTIKSIQKSIPNCNLFVKKHPREKLTHWEQFSKKYSSINIINDHIHMIAPNVDFVITFLGSGAVDCYEMGVPVIEFCNLNQYTKGGMFIKEGNYTTIYRNLGIVIPANNEEELQNAIYGLVKTNYKLQSNIAHPFYKELIGLSNTWDKKIRSILASHNFISN